MCNCNQIESMMGLGMGFTISADSVPDSPESWNCADWKVWHEALVQRFGRDQANQIWLREWEDQSTFSYNANWCKYNSDWVNYFDSQGLDMRSIVSALFTGGGEIVDNVLDVGNTAVSTVGNTLDVGKYIVPAALVVGIGLVGFIVYKNSTSVFEVAKNVTSK